MLRRLFRALRIWRDARALARGRYPQRVWNRGVTRTALRVARKLYWRK